MNNAIDTLEASTKFDASLYAAVTQFLFQEAELMDGHRFDDWLSLWSEQGRYWVPCNTETLSPDKSVSLIYETRAQLDDRVFRLKGRHAHAQNPRSRLMRVVSNIVIENATEEQVTVRSNFVLGEVRVDREEVWFGRNTHLLLRQGDALFIREKTVFLLNNDSVMSNLTFLV